MLKALASLAEQNLVVRRNGPAGRRRVAMLETIRESALERLEASGEVHAASQAHAAYYAAVAVHAIRELEWKTDDAFLERLDQEYANIRAALLWTTHSRSLETGLTIAGNLWRFWDMRGNGQEGLSWIENLLDRTAGGSVDPAVRGEALLAAGSLARSLGLFDLAGKRYEEAAAIFSRLGDPLGIENAVNGMRAMSGSQGAYRPVDTVSKVPSLLH